MDRDLRPKHGVDLRVLDTHIRAVWLLLQIVTRKVSSRRPVSELGASAPDTSALAHSACAVQLGSLRSHQLRAEHIICLCLHDVRHDRK